MKILNINGYNSVDYCAKNNNKNKYPSSFYKSQNLQIAAFRGKSGKFLGGLLGGAAGGAAGGAIIGGGSLAGMLAVSSALGPIGWGLAAAYTIGGALTGGYIGSAVGDEITENKNNKKNH